MASDVTKIIDRLEAFEERVGVRLESLFGYVTDGYLTVNGVVYPRQGQVIEQDTEVHLDAYDSAGRLVADDEADLWKNGFFGFETFQLGVPLPAGDLASIRVYPKRGRSAVGGPRSQATAREFETFVVGIKYHRGHAEGLTPGDLVQLVREPENIHDTNAVQVRVLADELLGYIPSEIAATLAQQLDDGMCAQARISRLLRKSVFLVIAIGETGPDIQRFVPSNAETTGQQ